VEEAPDRTDPLVVICAGERAFDEVGTLLSNMPRDLPGPVVVLVDTADEKMRVLYSVLENVAQVSYERVRGNATLEPGKIYVVSAEHDITLSDSTLVVRASAQRSTSSLSRVLISASTAYGDRLIAVFLSPESEECASAAIEVKRRHGTVLAREDGQAKNPIPIAIPPTLIDGAGELDHVGSLLTRFARTSISGLEDEEALKTILSIASRQASIDFRAYKMQTIRRRIARRVAVTMCSDLSSYADYLETYPNEAGELVMSFLIRVTEFFRDPDAYVYLKTHVLPELIKEGRERDRSLRIWSVGCATGEEPYSLSLLLADLLGNELPEWTIKIFATDAEKSAVEFGRRGMYPSTAIDNIPWEYRSRFFTQTESGYRIAKSLRQMVIFGHQDLTRGAPFPRINLVTCRNVMIYFKPELQQDVLDLFAYSLAPVNGHLFLGKAETVRPSKSRYELINKKWKVYRCIQGPRIAPTRQLTAASMRGLPAADARGAVSELPKRLAIGGDGDIAALDPAQVRRVNELLLRYLPIGLVVIDRAYRIVSINGAARRMLGIHETVHEQDFLHTARSLPYTVMRNTIDTSFRQRVSNTLEEVVIEPASSREIRYASLTFGPILADSNELLVISLQDTTDAVQTRRAVEQSQAQQRELIDQVETANRRLSELNRELQQANDELQAANEEMMLGQEELQATNEEFEATNEELQATNEELETNNEELQATNEELEATNDELTARTQELVDLTRELETERKRLGEMVELAPVYMLIARGPSLVIEAFNAQLRELFGDRDIGGRPLLEAIPDGELNELVSALHEVYRSDGKRVVTTKVRSKEGAERELYLRWTIVPTHDHEPRVDGLVIYGEDVTASA
jgi:two-component system CheB/CheR fusion protein